MNKYEAMFITKSDISESKKKALFDVIQDVITKNEGKILSSSVWAEKKKLNFPIKKFHEADYFLVNFELNPLKIISVKENYRLNEDILRLQIIKEG
ncbi:MAG: 30S ribosomal protein S6 [Candidatus Omnitrophota bacterium]